MSHTLLTNTRRPDITFRRDGRINITSSLAKALSLCPGDAINIKIIDGEFLLFASHNCSGKHHAQCWPSKRSSNHYCANSVILCRALLDAINIHTAGAAFYVGAPTESPIKTYIPIITRNPIIL